MKSSAEAALMMDHRASSSVSGGELDMPEANLYKISQGRETLFLKRRASAKGLKIFNCLATGHVLQPCPSDTNEIVLSFLR